MKGHTLIALLICLHSVTGSVPLDKITEKVHAGLKHLTEKAASKLHKLSEGIDLHKLQQHILHAAKTHKHYVHTHAHHHIKKSPLILEPHQAEKLKLYFEPHVPHHHHHHKPAPVHYHHVDHTHH